MAEYWRYADRMAPGPVPGKRPRSEYDITSLGAAAYYPREEPRYEERDGRLAWRELEAYGSADFGRSALAYGSGSLTTADLTGSTLLGGVDAVNQLLGLDAGLGKASNLALNGGRSELLSRQDSQVGAASTLPPSASNTLFVEGLPADCTKREAAHIFRPFVGFKEVRLVHKEAKRPGVEQFVLCFVDFTDPRSAAVALEALQGYKFDETNPTSESLRLQFARYPGVRAGGRDDTRGGRDDMRNRSFRR